MSERADVVVVGAGLAGLAAAGELCRAGLQVTVVEAGAAVGGRVRTDVVDGFRLDRGFQLLNPAYPEARRLLDLDALDLQPLTRGLLVALGDRRWRLADPRHEPGWIRDGLSAPVGSVADRLRLARWAIGLGAAPARGILHRDDVPSDRRLRDLGLSHQVVDTLLRPFLSGVFLEDRLTTSSRFLELVVRSFLRGTPAVPALGMQQIPEQLASSLPSGTIRLELPVRSITSRGVETPAGELAGDAVIVATDPVAAARLIPGLSPPHMHACTTWYHAAAVTDEPLTLGRPVLVVDGEQRGPVTSTVVMSHAAPRYSPDHRVLVSSTTLGTDTSAEAARLVRRHLASLHCVDTTAWEEIAVLPVPEALPAMRAPHPLARDVAFGPGRFLAGDHRTTSSIQGALVSGRRAAAAVLAERGRAQ